MILSAFYQSNQHKYKELEPSKLTLESLKTDIHKEEQLLRVSYKQQPGPDHANWENVLESYRIRHDRVYQKPPAVLEFVGKDGEASQFASLGNFSAIIGRAKSRKTFSVCLYLAAAIKNNSKDDFIRCMLPDHKKRIAEFDTEQSEYDVSCVVKRILALAEVSNPAKFDVFSLRPLSPRDRLFVIEQYIYANDDLGIVVIDGIRDLISDINSPEEATMISSRLLKWTHERNIHIIVVIHQNKGDNNARGHVGTEIINKSEAVISVEKDGDISRVKPEFMRGKEFEPFAFNVNQDGLPQIIEDWQDNTEVPKKQKLMAGEVSPAVHGNVLREFFKDGQPKKYKDMETGLKVLFQAYDIRPTQAQILEFIAYYKMKEMIRDTGGKGRSGNQYFLGSL